MILGGQGLPNQAQPLSSAQALHLEHVKKAASLLNSRVELKGKEGLKPADLQEP